MYDVIIIGGGPAGLTAAIYAGRRAMKTLLLTRDIGGQATKALEVENYPGLDKVSGFSITQKMKNQAEQFGAEIKYLEVTKISPTNDEFEIETSKEKFQSKTIIITSGKTPLELGVKGEEQFKGKGVSYCVTCDAPFFKEKTVVIVGGGNSALDAALLCSKICKEVYLLHRRADFRAEEILIDKVKKTENIEIIYNDEIEEIIGTDKVEKVILKSKKEVLTDGVFIEVGYKVDRKILDGLLKLNEKSQVIVDQNQVTSEPGIFAAGDVTEVPYKQIIISAGDGAKAALASYDYLQRKEGKQGIAADWH